MFLPVTASKVLLLENFRPATRVNRVTGLSRRIEYATSEWSVNVHLGLHEVNVHLRTRG